MKPKTIAIIGAGPVGGILAAHLCSAGHSIHLVDTWEEHIRKIEAEGLKITGNEEKTAHPDRLLTSVSDLGDPVPEFIFICTKACYLDSVLRGMSDGIKHSNTVFISAQNGIDTEHVIVENIGAGHVLRAVITFAGFPTGPGVIKETFYIPPSYIGWLNAEGEAPCREVAEIVTAAGLTMEPTAEIQKHVWRKTILNTCTMAIAAVTGLNMQEQYEFAPTHVLIEDLLRESIRTAAAYGFDYGPDFFNTVMEFNEKAGPHRPSMLVDLENGRKTENGFIVRRVAEYAERKGIPAPAHRTMAICIDALEMRGLKK
ncbi:MAG: 2-dehydropantoate 2-reductase [Acidobacteria bacterium]|nr:2-dehydropantoate 2-reductase [Acidobacteriota bacterium]